MLWPQRIIRQRVLVIFRAKSSSSDDISQLIIKMPAKPTDPIYEGKLRARFNYEARKNISQKSTKGNKFFSVEVLGNGAHGCPRSVNMYADNFRGLFNCGEGTQRLANEYKVKIVRYPRVFITYPSWENVSGLLGMALSLQSIGIPELNLHGPKSIGNIFLATNKFVALRALTVKVIDILEESEFNDSTINIKSVPLYPSYWNGGSPNCRPSTANDMDSAGPYEDDTDYYAHLGPVKRKSNQKDPQHDRKKLRSQSVESDNTQKLMLQKFAVSYICRSKETLGKLLIDKCVDLGVPVGPVLQKLKNGETVTLENGTVVRSEDVTSPNLPGAVVIVLECPSEDYLDSLLKEPAFYKHQSGDVDDIASLVIHFSPAHILSNPRYKEWINRFPVSTKHLYINDSNKLLGSIGVHKQQHKLHMIHPEIFPLLVGCDLPPYPRQLDDLTREGHSLVQYHPTTNTKEEVDTLNIYPMENEPELLDEVHLTCDTNPHIKAETLCKMQFRPVVPFDYSKSLVLKRDLFSQEVLSNTETVAELDKLRETLSGITLSNAIYPKMVFLGTGSSQPNKLRNSSGILVFANEDKPFLLDCGEGTYSQMVQFFGKAKAWDILSKLTVIYISHLHADHHIGLITLLKWRYEAIKEKQASHPEQSVPFKPVFLLAPVQLSRWLKVFETEFDSISHLYTLIPNLGMVDHTFIKERYNECLDSLNMKEIKMTLVHHCPFSFGVALTHNDGWKLTYSGDTMPCHSLVELGRNSDILIHEATMDDSLQSLARKKLHSTSSQAISIGKQMNAKFIILTHFSQRYAHIPFFNQNFTDEVGIAFDNMTVSYNQLPLLSKFIPAFMSVFSEYYKEMEEKRDAFQLREKRRLRLVKNKSPSHTEEVKAANR